MLSGFTVEAVPILCVSFWSPRGLGDTNKLRFLLGSPREEVGSRPTLCGMPL